VAKPVTLETWSVSDVPRNIDPQMESWIHGLLRQLRRLNTEVRDALDGGLTVDENGRAQVSEVVYRDGVVIPWDTKLGAPTEVQVRSYALADDTSPLRASGGTVVWSFDGLNVSIDVPATVAGVEYDMVIVIYGSGG
jgi:hypothetical protein